MALRMMSLSFWCAFAALLATSFAAPTAPQIIFSMPNGVQKYHEFRSSNHSMSANFTFDDIDLSKTANRTLDSHRFLKDFQNFQVMNTTAANHSGILAPEDMNCAASKPNALRNIPGPYSPNSFFGSDAKALNAMNVSEYFDVMSFTAKPIGPVDAYTLITVNAWELDGKDGKNLFSVYIWYGDEEKFAEPLQLDMQEIFPGWGVKVNWLEFAAETEYGDPWDFCLDNVVLRFHKEGDEDEEIYHVL